VEARKTDLGCSNKQIKVTTFCIGLPVGFVFCCPWNLEFCSILSLYYCCLVVQLLDRVDRTSRELVRSRCYLLALLVFFLLFLVECEV